MFDEHMDRLNRSALLVVNERYLTQLDPWVKNSTARLKYVQKDVARIVGEVVEETGAEFDYVFSAFQERLKDRLAEPEAVAVKWVKGDEGLEGVHKDDIVNGGEVEGAGLEEALDPEGHKTEDLGSYTKAANLKDASTWSTCFRCTSSINPIWATFSPVCKTCTDEIKLAVGEGMELGQDTEDTEHKRPSNPEKSELFQCKLCKQEGQLTKGTHEELVAHVEDAHEDVLRKEREGDDSDYTAKVADVPRSQEDVAVAPPKENNPADRFDDIIQDMADSAAAQQFSNPSDEVVNQIASATQQDPQAIKDSLYATATFGKYTGVNGHIDTDGNTVAPEGYGEVPMQAQGQDQGGRIGAHQAIVPVNEVMKHVANEMGMTPELVESMVKDRYGTDLPDKYHASVSGEHHFYLPQEMVANIQETPPQQQPVAPVAPPAQPQPQI